MSNPLERIEEQRAQRLLDALQSDLRAQMRLDDSEMGGARRGSQQHARERMKKRLQRLADPHYREKVWNATALPEYDGRAVQSLPKTRAFWEQVDNLASWSKAALNAACQLLDLGSVDATSTTAATAAAAASSNDRGVGKKMELVARIQDWIHEPELQAKREEQARLAKQHDAMLASGRVFAIGNNFNGELGLGHRRNCVRPTEVESLRGCNITSVVSGFDANFAFALSTDTRVFGWGGGGRALFDVAHTINTRTEHRSINHVTTAVAATALSDTPVDPLAPTDACFLFPRDVTTLLVEANDSASTTQAITTLVCARTDGHVGFTTASGACFMWGRGDNGELGIDPLVLLDRKNNKPRCGIEAPVCVPQLLHTTALSVGNCHAAAVTADGKLFTWGGCFSGQLGLGECKRAGVSDRRAQRYFPSPTLVEALAIKRYTITRVSCGAVHTAAISTTGQLFTFGCNDGGRLGLGVNSGSDQLQPQLVTALEREVVIDVCCANWHSLCLVQAPLTSFQQQQTKNRRVATDRSDRTDRTSAPRGFVYAFGSGLQGQLGLGKQKIAALPTRLPDLFHRKVLCQAIAVSSHHSLALSCDGDLFTWGQNTSGCLGRSTIDGATDAADPDIVERTQTPLGGYGVGPIISIAAGDRFTLFATGPFEPPQAQDRAQFAFQEKLNRHSKFES